MGPTEARLRKTLQSQFSPVHFELTNESHLHSGPENRETHFRAFVVSAMFDGLSRVERQRRVYDAIKDELQPGGVHAFAQKLLTPSEFTRASSDTFTAPPCGGGSAKLDSTDD